MPFVPNTPESFVSRADSKNPNSTCRGITSSGRPCRRPISTSTQASLSPRGRNNEPKSRKTDLSDETLYCWQHKEQASHSAQSSPGPRRHTKPILEERSSLDTLADRLGILDLQEKKSSKGGKGRPAKPAPSSKPLKAKPRPQLTCCFCFSLPLDEVSEPARPKPRPQPVVLQKHETASVPPNFSKPSHNARPSNPRISTPNAPPGKASYQSGKSTLSQTARFKHLLPDTLDVTTASALMAELAKPHTDSEEGGYIYMFWLTPETQKSKPPTEAARSLLAPPSVPSAGRSRRASDVVSSFAATDFSGRKTDQKTMLLKIGRAANVQRRMNQWQRQCGYDIEMLRYYPYVSGVDSDRPGTGRTPRMTPHCRKVERLIHIELTGMGLRADMPTCEACGREHREWFEVQASRDGIRAVDEVIRRWVSWDEASVA